MRKGYGVSIDALVPIGARRGIEAAGEQHLFDQRIELADVGVDLALELVALFR